MAEGIVYSSMVFLEKQDENTDNEVLNIFNNKLQINVKPEDLDRSHRLGRNRQVSSRPRRIIVKFARYNKRTEVFRSKKKPPGSVFQKA